MFRVSRLTWWTRRDELVDRASRRARRSFASRSGWVAGSSALLGEEGDDVRIAVLRAGHRLDDAAGVVRVVVAVEGHGVPVLQVAREEALARLARGERGVALRVDRGRVRAEVVPAVVELEGARVLALVDDVGAGAGRDAHGARRQIDVRRRLARLKRIGLHVGALVEHGLGRRHVLDVAHALLEALDDLLVVEAVGGRVLEPLAVDERDAAPRVEQLLHVGLAPLGLGRAPSRRGAAAPCARCCSSVAHSSSSNIARDAGLGVPGAQQELVALELLLDLHLVVGEQLGRRVDGREAAADDDRRAGSPAGWRCSCACRRR